MKEIFKKIGYEKYIVWETKTIHFWNTKYAFHKYVFPALKYVFCENYVFLFKEQLIFCGFFFITIIFFFKYIGNNGVFAASIYQSILKLENPPNSYSNLCLNVGYSRIYSKICVTKICPFNSRHFAYNTDFVNGVVVYKIMLFIKTSFHIFRYGLDILSLAIFVHKHHIFFRLWLILFTINEFQLIFCLIAC